MVICLNWMACAVYITACPPTLIRDRTDDVEESVLGQHCLVTSWLSLAPNTTTDGTLTDLYSMSAYFAIVTFMTVGFGDFRAANIYEVRPLSSSRLKPDFHPNAIACVACVAFGWKPV